MLRTFIRKTLSWVLVSVLAVISVSVVGEWFIKVAEEKGWYANAGQRFDVLMSNFSALVTSPWVLYSATLLTGLVVGLWIDWALARREAGEKRVLPRKVSPKEWEAIYRKVRAMQKRLAALREEDVQKVPEDLPYELLSLHVSLRRLGIATPDRDQDRWPADEYFGGNWAFLNCIAPLMRDGHRAEAKASAKRHLKTLTLLAQCATHQLPEGTAPETRP
ncbi:MAG: hypothetical protein EON59_09880 [Alphaproteobacteria bacterium]|nr:MAG: hypothetical protein EON59_09880 [Alphaproteobacteria bacterium]